MALWLSRVASSLARSGTAARCIRVFRRAPVLASLALLAITVATGSGAAEAAVPSMCGRALAPRQYTVFIDTGDPAVTGMSYSDALAGMERWNFLFREYYGSDIFVPFSGNWFDADVLVTPGTGETWVNSNCGNPGYIQRGNN